MGGRKIGVTRWRAPGQLAASLGAGIYCVLMAQYPREI